MASACETHFFLGANSPNGFASLYDSFFDSENDRTLFILKGGPGCGKSTFMKIIGSAAEKHSLPVEYIRCSGDPDSVDGVRIPSLGIAYVDGTAPHVMEPNYPAAAERYLDLGQFYDFDALMQRKEEIAATFTSYRALYEKAYECLRTAHAVRSGLYRGLFTDMTAKKIAKRAGGIASREFIRIRGRTGGVMRRYISAVTCSGRIFLHDTVNALADKLYLLDNRFGLASGMLRILSSYAVKNGWDVIECISPYDSSKLEHLIIPGLSLAFVTTEVTGGKIYRHVRLDSLADADALRTSRSRIRFFERIANALEDDAVEHLASAKKLHDELEAIYNPHVDFDAVRALAERHCSALFG